MAVILESFFISLSNIFLVTVNSITLWKICGRLLLSVLATKQVFLACNVLMYGVHVLIYHINAFGMEITLLCASILRQFAINISVGPCFYLSYVIVLLGEPS